MYDSLNNLEKIKEIPEIESNKYFYNSKAVPRVTEILSKCIHEDYLMIWSNALGLYKRKKYQDEMDRASFIGTNVHNFIEDYIRNNLYKKEDIKNTNDRSIINNIDNGVKSFILWYDELIKNNMIEILGMEQQLICPWFAGTYDLLMKINGKTYLVDFKTSNHIGYKYFLQLSAYKYILKSIYNINIDGGFIILQLDKYNIAFEEYLLDFNNKQHYDFSEQCIETFLSLVYSYYNILQVKQLYNNIF